MTCGAKSQSMRKASMHRCIDTNRLIEHNLKAESHASRTQQQTVGYYDPLLQGAMLAQTRRPHACMSFRYTTTKPYLLPHAHKRSNRKSPEQYILRIPIQETLLQWSYQFHLSTSKWNAESEKTRVVETGQKPSPLAKRLLHSTYCSVLYV